LPPALHFCITRPNARSGIAEAYLEALGTAVAYAKERRGRKAVSGAVYGFGGTALGTEMVKFAMVRFLDAMHDVPADPGNA
jgi:hypothetical protein